MISYYFQLFLGVFIFGFGIGSAMFLFGVLTQERLKGLTKLEVMRITEEAWYNYFVAMDELEEERSKNSCSEDQN